jgi:hypothetical protein
MRARLLRVAGTVRRLPAAGTVGGTGRHVTSSSRSDDTFTVIPVFNPFFGGWGFWYFGVWIRLY